MQYDSIDILQHTLAILGNLVLMIIKVFIQFLFVDVTWWSATLASPLVEAYIYQTI